jgi:hypothetical protein
MAYYYSQLIFIPKILIEANSLTNQIGAPNYEIMKNGSTWHPAYPYP